MCWGRGVIKTRLVTLRWDLLCEKTLGSHKAPLPVTCKLASLPFPPPTPLPPAPAPAPAPAAPEDGAAGPGLREAVAEPGRVQRGRRKL